MNVIEFLLYNIVNENKKYRYFSKTIDNITINNKSQFTNINQ